MTKSIGVDVGYGYTKIVTEDDSGLRKPILFRSIIGTYEEGIQVEGMKSLGKEIVSVANQRFLVGSSAVKHSTRILNSREKGWISSVAYKALWKYALRLADCNSENLTIASGLPINFYKTDKERLSSLIKEIAKDYCLNLTVKVIPQPAGSFFSFLFDWTGKVVNADLAHEKVGVLDIGYYTSDLITIHELEVVEKQTDSYETGISTALETISRDIEAAYGMRPSLDHTAQALEKGSIKVFGSEKDIKPIVQKRLIELAQEITARAKTVWKNAADIDRVILTGGGAEALKPYLNLFQHSTLIPEPQFSNAIGYYKLARRLDGGKA
jgi:plasmid segregation protein ParM